MKKLILKVSLVFLICQLAAVCAFAQQRTISGVVKALDTGKPLPGVNILVKGANRGTATDAQGRYEITVEPGAVLVFRAIGYKTKTTTVEEGQTTINIALEKKLAQLKELVVIGHGEVSRATLTASVSKMDTSVLQSVPYASVANALQGTVTGLRVQRTSGQPGAAPRIVLRGGTSINNPNGSQPLYIIDGVKRQSMQGLNANNIASIQVLKDAAATAIYGARAANGVVIIETKTGTSGEIRVNYESNLQISHQARLYNLASARQYIKFGRLGVAATAEILPQYQVQLTLPKGFGTGNDLTKNTAFTTMFLTPQNAYKLDEGWEKMVDPITGKTIIFNGHNWQDIIFRTALSQTHYLSVSGGSEKVTYRVGLGYLDSEGAAIQTGYERLNFDASGTVYVNDDLTVTGSVRFSHSGTDQVFDTDQIFQRALGLAPTAKLRFEDGTLAPGQNLGMGNPLYALSRVVSQFNENRTTFSLSGNWDITEHLSLNPQASLYIERALDNDFTKSYYIASHAIINTRPASASYDLEWQKELGANLKYTNTFSGSHNLSALAGFSYYDRKAYNLAASGNGAGTDLIPTLNASAEETDVYSYITERRIIGFYGRIMYDYKKKYLLTLTARYDGASNLGLNHKWGFFPGVSVGWNIAREPFWEPINDVISTFKVRASYGVAGDISGLDDFHAQGQYSVGTTYNDLPMVVSTRPPNPELKWERTTTFDVGLDMGFFRERLNVRFDYYRRITSDLLYSQDLPLWTGFASIFTNLGKMKNEGVEIEIEGDIIRNPEGFNWSMSFNASYNLNTILNLPENGNIGDRIGGFRVYNRAEGEYVYVGGLQEGQHLGNMYAFKQLYIFVNDQAAQQDGVTEDTYATGPKGGGDVKWLDVDGNGIIDRRDQVYVGNTTPDWTGGIATNLNYQNWSLYIRTNFALGHTIYNEVRARFLGQFQGDINITQEVVEQSWLDKDGRRQTKVPRYHWADQFGPENLWRQNSRYFEDGSYLALREITLSYSLPASWLEPLGLRSVQAHISANNLFYITSYNGLLPEDGGIDSGRYPIPRSYVFGINVSL